MAKFAIIHPWLPRYRQPFFEQLIPAAAAAGHVVEVFHGEPPIEVRARDDASIDPRFTELPTWKLLGSASPLHYKRLEALKPLRDFDAFIVEDAIRNLETYRLLFERRKVAFWGHGRTFTKPVSNRAAAAKQRLINRGAWFFSYTEGGRQHVVSQGFPPDRCTVVQNSLNTEALATSLAHVSTAQISHFNSQYDLRGKTALFVGGLDASKRLEFLFASADIAHAQDEDFRLLVGGRGLDEESVRNVASSRGYVYYLGGLEGARKALALRAAQALAMPGRVGLVAVDSFVARVPIVTTEWPWHAPEFEYLTHANAIVTCDSVSAYALGLLEVMHDPVRRHALERGCADSARTFTMDAMVQNFVEGLSNFATVL